MAAACDQRCACHKTTLMGSNVGAVRWCRSINHTYEVAENNASVLTKGQAGNTNCWTGAPREGQLRICPRLPVQWAQLKACANVHCALSCSFIGGQITGVHDDGTRQDRITYNKEPRITDCVTRRWFVQTAETASQSILPARNCTSWETAGACHKSKPTDLHMSGHLHE